MNQDSTVQKKSNICLKKKIVQRASPEKKFLHKQWAEKKIVQAKNPTPPPPHHFSNGPSLVTELTVVRCVNLMEMS